MLLITQPRVGTAHNEILSLHFAARELGWDVLPAPTSWRIESLIKEPGIPYGSQLFCEVIAQQMSWKLLLYPFDWLAKLPIKYTKRKIEFMNLGSARLIKETKFIKPADDKCFDAKVYTPGEFNPSNLIEDTYPCLVSEPIELEAEYRCFVDNSGKVTTWSNYLFRGELNSPTRAHDLIGPDSPNKFVESMINEIGSICPSVIDVGYSNERGLFIIESNPIWASGIYQCEPVEVLQAMIGSVQ